MKRVLNCSAVLPLPLMTLLTLPLVAMLTPPLAARAQSPATAPATAPVPGATSTLSTGTQLVVVDVTVLDRDSKPVHNLKSTDFTLAENKAPQTVKHFEEHSAIDRARLPPIQPVKLPPGMFTDYLPVPEDAPLNILLLDALNTPIPDQAYVRYQLQQYVKHAQPGTRIAIFGLTTRLVLLQGFTSDPEILRAVVDHKLIPRASVLLEDPGGSNGDPNLLSDAMSEAGASAAAVAGMQQFEAQNASFQTQVRTEDTLSAFNALARYLAGFPGRKNLIWFSGAFPLTVFGDATLDDPFAAQLDSGDALRATSNLLDRARVAVYPIDARGLQTNPMFSASRSGREYARSPQRMMNDISKFNTNNAEEHMAMDQIADDTGGRAFYNTNGLSEAVTKSIDAGSNFYTLAYAPANRKFDNTYRQIKVQLSNNAAQRGYKLAYRRGYYAIDPNDRKLGAESAVLTSGTAAGNNGTASRRSAFLDRGAPTPSEILFKVSVLPVSTVTEDTVFAHNVPVPGAKFNGPYRRFQVDFATLGSDLQVRKSTAGVLHGQVEFLVLVYDTDGKLLNSDSSTLEMNLQPATYAALLKSGLGFHQQVSVPAKGESFLRIAVHDLVSNHYGVVEVPVSVVSHLPPPPVAPPSAATPAPAPAASAPAPTAGPQP